MEIWGDTLENYSGRGPTPECIVKPDIIAPGADIVSCLTATPPSEKPQGSNAKIISESYVRMSGTSMSTPIVAGAVALLLQKTPGLTPDDVKFLLRKTSVDLNYSPNQQGWGLISIDKFLSEEARHVR